MAWLWHRSVTGLVVVTGHFKHYPIDYKAAVTELLGKAAGVYSHGFGKREGERMCVEPRDEEIIEPLHSLRKAAASSNGFQDTSLVLGDQSLLPSLMDYYEGRDVGALQDERREGVIHLSSPSLPCINAHGVLGQILYDVCVPKNVEGWDIGSSDSFKKGRFTSTRRHTHFNPIKCILRSRL